MNNIKEDKLFTIVFKVTYGGTPYTDKPLYSKLNFTLYYFYECLTKLSQNDNQSTECTGRE